MSEHFVNKFIYLWVCLVLLLLLGLTVGVSFINLGRFNAVMALTIAVAKTALIALFFIHLRWSKHLVWIVSTLGIIWLGIMFTLTLSDYLTRG